MTEQDKVTVDDIIGIVKTEEQTNSAKEVRKLRGRGNETAKRFSYKLDEIFDEGNHFAYALSKENAEDIVELLNELHEENTMLKERRHEDINELAVIAMKYQALERENEQLKTTIQQLRTDNTKQKKLLNTTMKENEQLKKEIEELKQALIHSAFDR